MGKKKLTQLETVIAQLEAEPGSLERKAILVVAREVQALKAPSSDKSTGT